MKPEINSTDRWVQILKNIYRAYLKIECVEIDMTVDRIQRAAFISREKNRIAELEEELEKSLQNTF